MSFFIKR